MEQSNPFRICTPDTWPAAMKAARERRKAAGERINKAKLNYMETKHQWISCADRMPTVADVNIKGRVLVRWPDESISDVPLARTEHLPPAALWAHIPALPKPVVKTQEQKDSEAFLVWSLGRYEFCQSSAWHAACAYTRKEIGERLGEIIKVTKIHDYEAGYTKVELGVFPKLNELARELTEAK